MVPMVRGPFAFALAAAAFAASLALAVAPALEAGGPASEGGAASAGRLLVVHGLDAVPRPETDFPGALPSFEQRYVGEDGAWEPPLAFAEDGTLFVGRMFSGHPTGPVGPFNPTLTQSQLLVSRDDGTTWEDATPALVFRGGDPLLLEDRASGRVYWAVYNWCVDLAWTEDAGATWTQRPQTCDVGGVQDHPTLFAGPLPPGAAASHPSALYLCYNAAYGQKCQRSLDGGLTFGPIAPPYGHANNLGGLVGSLGVPVPGDCSPTLGGRGHADPLTGVVYVGSMDCSRAHVAVSRDHGGTWQVTVLQPGHEPVAAAGTGGHEVDVEFATDAVGTTYALWIDSEAHLPTYVFTRDQGRTWTAPRVVAPPGLTAAKFPALVAGDEGRISLAYIGTFDEGGFDPTDAAGQTWHALMSVAVDADGESAVFATGTATTVEDPARRGPCADRCYATEDLDESMGDYLFLRRHPLTGAVVMTFNDLCVGACAEAGADAGVFDGDRASLGVQVGGLTIA